MENLVKCSIINLYLQKSELDREQSGQDFFEFSFYVDKQETADMMFFIISLLSNYDSLVMDISAKEQRYVPYNEVWSKNTIKQCLEANLTFRKQDEMVPKLTF